MFWTGYAQQEGQSSFGQQMGVEIVDLIFFLQHYPDKGQFWKQIVGQNTERITRSKDLFKLTYALVFATMKIQHKQRKERAERTQERVEPLRKPSADAVKQLTRVLRQKMKRGADAFVLTKIEYIVAMNNYLYQAAVQLKCVEHDTDDDAFLAASDKSDY